MPILVLRISVLLAAILAAAPLAAQNLRPQDDATAPSTPAKPKSRVVLVEKPALVSRFQVDEAAVAVEFNRALMALTRKNSVTEAWRSLVSPADVVGLKINTAGGSILCTHPALVEAIVAGLEKSGIPPEQVVIWDKFEDQMLAAGYVPMQPSKEWRCQSVVPGAGFDGEKFFFHEIAGQLIWGDRDFIGKVEKSNNTLRQLLEQAAAPRKNESLDPFRDNSAPKDGKKEPPPQVSNRSYFARILTRDVTKIINLPVLSDHDRIGLSGCLSSLTLGSIDNQRRFLNDSQAAAEAIADLYSNELISKKTILHVMDGLVCQYAGGPAFNPHYAASPGLLMLSTDPVALDTLALERIEDGRRSRGVIPVSAKAGHIAEAALAGLGNNKPELIEITVIP
ncbi:MAG: DUF362 domain-containing protein [Candidatus Methylacidiphilales bacterium]|nr:DUF362 domain-containing protein [Candidatus Methylacidiphilales bacterium]